MSRLTSASRLLDAAARDASEVKRRASGHQDQAESRIPPSGSRRESAVMAIVFSIAVMAILALEIMLWRPDVNY